MERFLTLAFCTVVLWGAVACAGELGSVGLQRQLLVDDYVIAEKHNITRCLGQPKKLGVVMGPSVPTDFDPVETFPEGLPQTGGYYEFGRRLSVLWNEKRQTFQMLYRASAEALTGYAESIDGIQWTKPMVSRDGKSNLISHRGKSRGTFYEASFMIDPTLPWGHPEKYKAAFNPAIRSVPLHTRLTVSTGQVTMKADRSPDGQQIPLTKFCGIPLPNATC